MLRRDEAVLHGVRFLLGRVHKRVQCRGKVELGRAAHLGEPLQRLLRLCPDMGGIGPDLLQDRHHQPPFLLQERQQQVLRLKGAMPPACGALLGGSQGFLGLYGNFVGPDHRHLLFPDRLLK